MTENSLPRKQRLYLIRHFFGRFFDSEILATLHTEMHILFIQILAMLVLPGLLKTFLSIIKYSALAHTPIALRDQAALIDAHFFICLSMILTGFVTVFEWEALFPDKKDFYNLISLPIAPQTIFFAKLAALSLFILLFNIAINGIPTWLFPAEVLTRSMIPGAAGYHIPFGAVLKYQIAHGTSLLLSSLFVFTSFLIVRALFLLIFPVRMVRMASRCAQLSLILVLLCSLFSFPVRLLTQGDASIYFLPPFWFLGLYETLIGHHGTVLDSLSKMAYMAVAVSAVISAISYTISYQFTMQKGFQSEACVYYRFSGIRKIWNRLLHRAYLNKPIERASYHFIAQTVFRRQEQMLYWGSFIAVGIALIYWDYYNIRSSHIVEWSRHFAALLSFPLILSFFLLVGLRFAFSIPADLNANWTFQIIDRQELKKAYSGVYKFMLLAIMIPLLVFVAPLYLTLLPPGLVFLHITYVSILSLFLIEVLLFQCEKLPFTCSYLPGKANIKLWWPAYAAACYFYSYGMTVFEQWMLRDIRRYCVFIVIAAGAVARLNRSRCQFLKRILEIRFEEKSPDAITLLTIER